MSNIKGTHHRSVDPFRSGALAHCGVSNNPEHKTYVWRSREFWGDVLREYPDQICPVCYNAEAMQVLSELDI